MFCSVKHVIVVLNRNTVVFSVSFLFYYIKEVFQHSENFSFLSTLQLMLVVFYKSYETAGDESMNLATRNTKSGSSACKSYLNLSIVFMVWK